MSEDTKHRIIEAGAELVHRQGFNNTGLKDILKAAGVPKGSFYFYFDNKEAFGIEMVHYFRDRFRAGTASIINDKALTPLERITGLFAHFKAYYEMHGYTRGCPIGNLAQEMGDLSAPFRAALHEALDGMVDVFEGLIVQAQEAGESPKDLDAREAATFVVEACHGAFIRMKVVKNAEPLNICHKFIIEILLK